jgi:hypothetical protein
MNLYMVFGPLKGSNRLKVESRNSKPPKAQEPPLRPTGGPEVNADSLRPDPLDVAQRAFEIVLDSVGVQRPRSNVIPFRSRD